MTWHHTSSFFIQTPSHIWAIKLSKHIIFILTASLKTSNSFIDLWTSHLKLYSSIWTSIIVNKNEFLDFVVHCCEDSKTSLYGTDFKEKLRNPNRKAQSEPNRNRSYYHTRGQKGYTIYTRKPQTWIY